MSCEGQLCCVDGDWEWEGDRRGQIVVEVPAAMCTPLDVLRLFPWIPLVYFFNSIVLQLDR
jgi:hypothetical protein